MCVCVRGMFVRPGPGGQCPESEPGAATYPGDQGTHDTQGAISTLNITNK